MERVRKHAFADFFYPANKIKLQEQIHYYLEHSLPSEIPNIIIAPHAGYMYSGSVAASAYAPFYKNNCMKKKDMHQSIQKKRIIVIGPSHKVPFHGIASTSYDWFSTPHGNIRVDQDEIQRLLQEKLIIVNDRSHEIDHCIEVQLPFLQMIFPNFDIVPLLTGSAPPRHLAYILSRYLDFNENFIVISSDLSHYLDYTTCQRKDRQTAESIVQLDENHFDENSACGRTAILGTILLARKHALKPVLIDLRNSGDTAKSKDSVVGYGAFHFYKQKTA